MTTTITTRVALAAQDNRLPVRCKDPLGQATATDDLVFDFRTPVQFAAGVIPAAGQPIPDVAFGNLALNDNAVLGRAGQAVRLEQSNPDHGYRNTADGRGLSIMNGDRPYPDVYTVRKAGVADGAVGCCRAEGFRDFMLDAVFLIREGAGVGVLGRAKDADIEWGIQFVDGYLQAGGLGAGALRMRPYAVGQVAHVGLHIAFDAASGTSAIRIFAEGAEVGTARPFRPMSEFRAAGDVFVVAGLGGYAFTALTLIRMRRVFTQWPGTSPALDPLAIHRGEHAPEAAL